MRAAACIAIIASSIAFFPSADALIASGAHKENDRAQRLVHIQEHLKSLNQRLAHAEAMEMQLNATRADPEAKMVPGTPKLEEPMSRKAPEQGFKGKEVMHVDQETHTGDWGKEYAYHTGSKTGGAPSQRSASLVVALISLALCRAY
mmetsp:Transcript_64403/g.119761  ORF Transcript_64403/g.119761 Transcript_64403/m.119761 type:complete len:147 (+) Transcript_64403:85-525(+)